MGQRNQCGFTLIEVAIVLLIVGLLSRSLLGPLASAQEQIRFNEAESSLHVIKESLLAHVVATGTLPCPVSPTVALSTLNMSGADRVCDVSQGGIPARNLRIGGAVDSRGALLDAWDRPYLYAVSLANHTTEGNELLPDWTSVGEASFVGIPNLRADLTLCTQASTASCPSNKVRANELAFIVLSHGSHMSQSLREIENTDKDNVFILSEHSLQEDDAYDDHVVWSSAQEVMYWMLRATWLP